MPLHPAPSRSVPSRSMRQLCELRRQCASVPEELVARMPMAYIHLVGSHPSHRHTPGGIHLMGSIWWKSPGGIHLVGSFPSYATAPTPPRSALPHPNPPIPIPPHPIPLHQPFPPSQPTPPTLPHLSSSHPILSHPTLQIQSPTSHPSTSHPPTSPGSAACRLSARLHSVCALPSPGSPLDPPLRHTRAILQRFARTFQEFSRPVWQRGFWCAGQTSGVQ